MMHFPPTVSDSPRFRTSFRVYQNFSTFTFFDKTFSVFIRKQKILMTFLVIDTKFVTFLPIFTEFIHFPPISEKTLHAYFRSIYLIYVIFASPYFAHDVNMHRVIGLHVLATRGCNCSKTLGLLELRHTCCKITGSCPALRALRMWNELPHVINSSTNNAAHSSAPFFSTYYPTGLAVQIGISLLQEFQHNPRPCMIFRPRRNPW